jgi:AAA domain
LLELRSPARSVIFDRTPLDFLAYLAALGASVEAEADASVLRSALASLDLLVVVPMTPETEQVLPRAEMLRLRENVNDMLLDLLDNDSLQILGDVPVIDLTGPIDRRPEAVLAALPAQARLGREVRAPRVRRLF